MSAETCYQRYLNNFTKKCESNDGYEIGEDYEEEEFIEFDEFCDRYWEFNRED